MKRILGIFLAAVLVFSGCTAEKKESIQVGLSADFPPYEFYEDGKIVGIDPEIIQALAEEMGTQVEIQDMKFASVLAGLENGKIDVGISGITASDERKKSMDFTDSYAKSVQKVLVAKGGSVNAVEDLTGKKIGVQLGTTGAILAMDEFGEENVSQFDKYGDAVLSLTSGKIDAIILDAQPAEKYAEGSEGKLEVLETPYVEEEYAIAVAKDNKELVDALNKALATLKEKGTIDEILNKYIPEK